MKTSYYGKYTYNSGDQSTSTDIPIKWVKHQIDKIQSYTDNSCTWTWGNSASSWSENAFFGNELVDHRNKLGSNSTYELPDGSKLIIDIDGNYHIDDKDAKVIYKANRFREFSPYINASEMLAEFVKDIAKIGVKQRDEILNLPINLFISWLIISQAERDGDDIPEGLVQLEKSVEIKSVLKPKCLQCKKFIPRNYSRLDFMFCNPEHATKYLSTAV